LRILFDKNVPVGVRRFLALRPHNLEIIADLAGEEIVHFAMPRYRG
jgi:hypothetical protein